MFFHEKPFLRGSFVIFLLLSSPVLSEDSLKKESPAPELCGSQDLDNRPNWCSKLVDETWVQYKSQCKKVGDRSFIYKHCSGEEKEVSGSCCMESTECPGAFYVAECIDLK
jgi:hypothetical protein